MLLRLLEHAIDLVDDAGMPEIALHDTSFEFIPPGTIRLPEHYGHAWLSLLFVPGSSQNAIFKFRPSIQMMMKYVGLWACSKVFDPVSNQSGLGLSHCSQDHQRISVGTRQAIRINRSCLTNRNRGVVGCHLKSRHNYKDSLN